MIAGSLTSTHSLSVLSIFPLTLEIFMTVGLTAICFIRIIPAVVLEVTPLVPWDAEVVSTFHMGLFAHKCF